MARRAATALACSWALLILAAPAAFGSGELVVHVPSGLPKPDPVCAAQTTRVRFKQHFDFGKPVVRAEVKEGNSKIKQKITLTYGETAADGGSISKVKFEGLPLTTSGAWKGFIVTFSGYKVVIQQLTFQKYQTLIKAIEVRGFFSSHGAKKLKIHTEVLVKKPCTGEFDLTGSAEATVDVVEVEKIDVVSGATAVADGTATPADTDVCVAIKGTGDVLLQANLDPDIPEADVPAGLITWTGGNPVTGHPLQRKVAKSAWGKTTVEVKCGASTGPDYTMLLYIIGAQPTGFKPSGADTGHFADFVCDDGRAAFVSTGNDPPAPATGNSESRCEIQFTVRPSDIVTDGNANLFDTSEVDWDVSRQKKKKKWKKVAGLWTQLELPSQYTNWNQNDTFHGEEDTNPWDSDGHVYGRDKPTFIPGGTWTGYVKKFNMREWVRVDLGPGADGTTGTRCSDYKLWRVFRSFKKEAGTWQIDATYGDELAEGNLFWGTEPP